MRRSVIGAFGLAALTLVGTLAGVLQPAGAASATPSSTMPFLQYGTYAISATGEVNGFQWTPPHLAAPLVGITTTPDGQGAWLVAADGGVFAYGDATFYGSMGGQALNAPIVGIAMTPGDKGYWEVASDGGIFAFGDATFEGSMGGHPLDAPIVGAAATPEGKGYWEVASDGGIFAFGDAAFYGSLPTGQVKPNAPIVAVAASPDGQGYWLAGADGGVFAFGDAPFLGSKPSSAVNGNVIAIEANTSGTGIGYGLFWQKNGAYAAFGSMPVASCQSGFIPWDPSWSSAVAVSLVPSSSPTSCPASPAS